MESGCTGDSCSEIFWFPEEPGFLTQTEEKLQGLPENVLAVQQSEMGPAQDGTSPGMCMF